MTRTLYARIRERPRGLGRAVGPPLPPKRLRFMGESDKSFTDLGDELAQLLVDHAGLSDDSRVLDIGCGYGRLPHALKRNGFAGSYLGIDVLRQHVRWASKRLGDGSFEFRHVDLRNERYNPKGTRAVSDLDLGDDQFDVIAAFSVFTHMWPADVQAYFRLISRALAPGGRAATTFFLLDHVWHRLAKQGQVVLEMPFEREAGCRYQSEDEPLHRVAYEGGWVMLEAGEAGLAPAAPPVWGTWSGRSVDRATSPPYQDVVVFRRLDEVET